MNQITTALFLSLVILLSVSIAEARTDVFKTKVHMDVGWFNILAETEEEAALSITDLNEWSNLVSPYLQLVLSKFEREANATDIIDVVLTVRDQTTTKDIEKGASVAIDSTVHVWYIAEEAITNLKKVFEEALEMENGVEAILRDVALIRDGNHDINDFYVNISSIENDTQHLYTVIPIFNQGAAHRGLVVACTFLVFSLLFVTGVVIWMAGGCPLILSFFKNPSTCFKSCGLGNVSLPNIDLKSSVKSESKTDGISEHKSYRKNRKFDRKLLGDSVPAFDSMRFDGDDTTTASGILGALPSYDTAESSKSEKSNGRQKGVGYSDGVGLPPGTMPVGFTPKRSVFREQDCDDSQIMTPMSTATDYSVSKAIPLGIAPGGKLTYRSSPDKNGKDNDDTASPGYLGRLGKLNYY